MRDRNGFQSRHLLGHACDADRCMDYRCYCRNRCLGSQKYGYPWFLTVAIPWLKTHNLVAIADMAVKYAESELGRYTGVEKLKHAIALMKAKGFNMDSDEVIAALKAAWETLDL